MHRLFIYIAVFATTALMAQEIKEIKEIKVTGSIDPINTADGLHKIQIPSLVRSFAAGDIRDFRILNTNGEQVPYFAHRDAHETRVSDFLEFEIVKQSRIPDSSATYIFKNTRKKLKKVVLSIANYEGSKRISLQGSDDQKQWFGLVNSQQLYGLKSATATSVYKVLDFPLNSYRYIKIVFDDRHSLPINLLQIGTAKTTTQKATLTTIPIQQQTITELIKDKKTQVHIRFEHPQVLHQIRFEINAPDFYNRDVRLYTVEKRTFKNKTETYKNNVANFTLRSDGPKQFPISFSFEKDLFIEIANQDNPKLEIASISFLQEPLYVIADLKKGEEYQIIAGDKTLKAPKYDLSYFKNRISDNLPKAIITNVTYTTPEIKTATKNVSFWQQSWFMWCCIGVAGILVAYFATSLIKDMKGDGL